MTGASLTCARYFGSDGTLCSIHNGRFEAEWAAHCDRVPVVTGASLAGPLARALAQIGVVEDDRDEQYRLATHDTARVLAHLRANPATLAAMAEALHSIDKRCVHLEDCADGQAVWKQCENWSGRILDHLLGAGSAAEGAEK